ncbi:MAG: DUF2277 domain-containing protein [Gammaproteobacteria bacterium]
MCGTFEYLVFLQILDCEPNDSWQERRGRSSGTQSVRFLRSLVRPRGRPDPHESCSTFEPPATEREIRAASLQFVLKLCGFNEPSQANKAAFTRALEDVATAARVLMASLCKSSPISRD